MKYRSKRFRTDMAAVPHKVLRDSPSHSLLWYFYVVILVLRVSGGSIYVSDSRREKGLKKIRGQGHSASLYTCN